MGLYRTLSSGDVREILALFGVGEYRSHAPIAAGTINTNFAVDTAGGRFFVRINEGKSGQDVAREAAIVVHAASRGVRTPLPSVASTGKRYARWRDVYVSIFPWLDGQTLHRGQIGAAHASQVGAALAHLHLAGRDYSDHGSGRYEPPEILRRFDHVTASAGNDEQLARAIPVLAEEFEKLSAERAAQQPTGLIHGDLFIDNVLFDPSGNLVALLDFEQASWGRLAYDLAVSVLAFGFGTDDFRADVTRALIEGYGWVRPPTAEERAAFGAELRFAACRFAVTRITDVYLRRGSGAPAGKDFQRYIQRLLRVGEHLAARDGLLALA